jgi:hypothetical protein
VDHPVEIGAEKPGVYTLEQFVEIQCGELQQYCGEVDDFDVVATITQESLKSLKPEWEILIQRSDRNVSRGAQVREVDIAAFPEIVEGWSVDQY